MAFPDASFAPSFSSVSFSGFSFYLGSEEPTDNVRSGVWRLQLMKLQEEALAKRKEIVADAVAKVLPEKVVKDFKKPKVLQPERKTVPENHTRLIPIARPLVRSSPDLTLPLILQTWAIISETYLLQVASFPIHRMLLSKIESANDEEDVELLLLAA